MVAVHEIGEEHAALEACGVVVGEHTGVGQFPSEGVGNDEDDAFGGKIIGWVGGVAREVVEGFNFSFGGSCMEVAGAAGCGFVLGGHCCRPL